MIDPIPKSSAREMRASSLTLLTRIGNRGTIQSTSVLAQYDGLVVKVIFGIAHLIRNDFFLSGHPIL